MPKKKSEETQEQSTRFLKAFESLEADGELNPTEADEKFERALDKIASPAQKD